jgi:CheY-like chemotaxis protein
MAIVLVSDPDPQSRLVLTALVEALGHRVVDDVQGRVDAAVIEPASPDAVALVRQARQRHRRLPVVCVSETRPRLSGTRLKPLAYLRKPVPVGAFVRTLADAVGQAQHAVRPLESRASRRRREFAAAYR